MRLANSQCRRRSRFAASELSELMVDVVEGHVFPDDDISANVEADLATALEFRTKVWPLASDMMLSVAER